MSETSPRLALPFVQAAQAQKHITHNEAIERLDHLVQLTIVGFNATVPPASPVEGDIYALGVGATNDWATHDGELAAWANGGWLFITPKIGWHASMGTELRIWSGSAWELPDLADLQAIPGVGINTSYDQTNRLSVAADATLLNHSTNGGHQLKMNKATPTDTASLLFQTGWSGRAEMGTTGSDDFAIKVSPNGAAWQTAISIDASDARAHLPAGGALSDGSAAAPALSFSANASTGLWRPGANSIGISTNGQERIRVTDAELQVTGAITGDAVTQTSSDTTAGRLMKVGDFGLGVSQGALHLAPSDNLDTLQTNGFYQYTSSTTGAPSTAGVVIHISRLTSSASGGLLQMAWGHDGAVWMRRNSGVLPTVWSPWRVQFNQDSIIGTVSQAAGLPTGAIIETGSNANGQYVRFADGTQICTANLASLTSGDTTWTFPAAFSTVDAPPRCTVSPKANAFRVGVIGTGTTGNSITFGCYDQAGARQINTCDLQAIGRWF